MLKEIGFDAAIKIHIFFRTVVQKQPPEVFYEKRCSEKFRKIHRKTLVPESLY